MEVNRINNLSITTLDTFDKKSENNSSKFIDLLKEAFEKVNDLQKDYDKMVNDFILGKDINIHDLMISAEKAKLSLELTVQIRNKVIEAYQEIMRMQI